MTLGRVPKNIRLETLVNYKVRVTTSNTSTFVGTLVSYDKYMNLVLSECEEFRLMKKSKNYLDNKKVDTEVDASKVREQKRLLGLVILRGENVISVVAESAPNMTSLKPQLRLKKSKITIKPLVKKLTSDTPVKSTGGGVQKPRRK
jgi:small nuclear ribonucleoprotein B and B'